MKKLRCCSQWAKPSVSTRVIEDRHVPGPQRHRVQHRRDERIGEEAPAAENHRVRPMPPTGPRQRAGSAHIIAPPGRASTRSGAATTMSSSCSIMWAVKRCSPSQCSGDTSASASEVQPEPEARRLGVADAAPVPGPAP